MNLEVAEKVFLEVYEILNKSQIELFLSDGTALGAIRDGGIIPWDYDIDTRIAAANWDFSIFEEFERNGFRCIKSINSRAYRGLPSGANIIKQGIKMGIGLNYYYPPEDLVAFLAGRPSSPGSLQPARFYKGNHFVDFLGIKVRIPYPPEEYTERIYGTDWRIPSRNGRAARKPISMKKYVDYFLEHPEINEMNAVGFVPRTDL